MGCKGLTSQVAWSDFSSMRLGVMRGTELCPLGWTSFHEATAMVGGQGIHLPRYFFKLIWTLFPFSTQIILLNFRIVQQAGMKRNSYKLSLKFEFNIHGFIVNKSKQNHVAAIAK